MADITVNSAVAAVTIPQRTRFDVCLEMNKLAFPASRRDDALFYIRPDMCIQQRNFDSILDGKGMPFGFQYVRGVEDKLLKHNLIDELIFIPTEKDLFSTLSGTLNQLTETLTSGWFAYTGVRGEDEMFIKGQGANPWFAMADAWLLVQKWKTKGDLTAQDIPDGN